jgi:tetratricopeptide (TPR) repeat protein
MAGKQHTAGRVAWLTALLVGALLLPSHAPANCSVERNVPGRALSEITWRKLNAIYEALGEERFGEAHDDLQGMLEGSAQDDYLAAILNQALARLEWARDDYAASLRHFERAIELDALPNDAHYALLYQVAQLDFMQGRLDEALARLDDWFCHVAPERITAHAYVLQASILAQQKRYPESLAAIDAAIGMAAEPQEAWYQLKLAAHYELEEYAAAAATLTAMVTRWPDRKTYWLQLSQLHLQLQQDDRALAVLALAHRKGLLDSQADITSLSGLYAARGVPLQAAQILEEGIADGLVAADREHWALVADYWFAAQEAEKALAAYGRAAAVAGDGGPDLRRGYLLIDLERWPGAIDALDRALRKGGMTERQIGEALLLRGMAHFNLGQYDRAQMDWERAGRNEDTRPSARQWLNHLQELRRVAAS